MNTKIEAYEIAKKTIEAAGFKTSGFGAHDAEFTGIEANHINLSLQTKLDWEGKVYRLSLRASISHMGGDPTPEELKADAEEISRAASLMEKFNALHLAYAAETY